MRRKAEISLSAAFTLAVFAFWMWAFPQGLNYQEQNQLFLWTWPYLAERLSVSGGLADWLGECLVQFFRIRWIGALIMALLSLAIQRSVLAASGRKGERCFFASFIPPVLWLLMCGDMEALVSFPVALIAALLLCRPFAAAGLHKLWAAPLAWWLIGPLAFIPVLYSLIIGHDARELAAAAWAVLAAYILHRLFLMQHTPRDVAFGINYNRLAEFLPFLQVAIPLISLLCALAVRYLEPGRTAVLTETALTVALAAGGWFATPLTYDKDSWELMAYSMLERDADYKGIISRAEKYQPEDRVGATYVNYALAMEGKLQERLWDFFQSGTDCLIMPSVRDNMSDIASCDVLWMIGMTNMSLQYAFDLQESIQNCRKSGRFTSRIAECHIVNGHYEIARRYLDKLTHTIFYRKWALQRLAMIDAGDEGVDTDPVYRYLRRAGFENDFIANYDTLDLMMAVLYKQNDSNIAAAIYYNAWQELKKAEQRRDEENPDTGVHGS